MDVLNWASDHWVFVLAVLIIASGTITVPKMFKAFLDFVQQDNREP
jgi:hypothetical protein